MGRDFVNTKICFNPEMVKIILLNNLNYLKIII